VVDELISLEFNMPDAKDAIRVAGKIRGKEVSGRSSVEFIDPSETSRGVIREYIYSKVTE